MTPPLRRASALLCLAAVPCLAAAGRGAPPRAEPAAKGVALIDQGASDPRLKGYQAAEGVKVEVVAEDPVVVNPVALAFGDDGTPYVLEWRRSPGDEVSEEQVTLTYKDGTRRTITRVRKKVKDVVKVLQAEPGKGTYPRSKVVLEDDLPSGLLLHDGWLYLAGGGSVRRYKHKGGGEFGGEEVVVKGFGGVGHRQVSGLAIGNDGWLYVSTGAGDNYVEGSDGSRATVLRSGAVFRCRPDGSRVELFAVGFCNPYGAVAFDAYANVFHADNDAGAGAFAGCRLLHVAEDADYGWRLRRDGGPDPFRTAVAGDEPGKTRPLLNTGRGAPSGLHVYNDTHFPASYRGLLLYPDVVRQRVQAYRLEPRGASFVVAEEFTLFKSDDRLFRPCQVVSGPDGAVYVVDWRTDSTGAGRYAGDGEHGRIYRLSWAGTKEEPGKPLRPMDSWAKVVAQSDADLLKTLAGEEAGDRARAQHELVRRGDRTRAALLKLLRDDEQPTTARVAALGVLHSLWNEEVKKSFQHTLAHGEEPLRRLAADGLGLNAPAGDKIAQDRLLNALNDNDPAVRRAVVLAMGRLAAPGAADALANALAFDEGGDAYLRDGILRGIERLGRPGIDRLLALAESGVKKETDRVVEAFAALRTRAAYEGLPAMLKYPHLSVEQRVKLIRSCGNYLLDPPVSPDAVIEFVSGRPAQPGEVKRAAAEWLAAGGAARTARADAWLVESLSDSDGAVRLAAIRAAGELRLAPAKGRLAELADDKARPAADREAAAEALRRIEGGDTRRRGE